MHLRVWRAGSAAIAIWLCAQPAGAVAAGPVAQLAQNDSNAGRVAAAPAASPANSPEQIRKAQVELKRLECLKGRIDGKLGERTRQAVKKFWASAKQPEGEVAITDELIASLAERGDLFCRPPRRFFALGGRSGGNPAVPFFAPGARPGPVPPTAAPPPAPAAPE
jgi:peptidoglycan hydrolase-like protein with peptidoglycan-binding domain